jgi:hypothetical protein
VSASWLSMAAVGGKCVSSVLALWTLCVLGLGTVLWAVVHHCGRGGASCGGWCMSKHVCNICPTSCLCGCLLSSHNCWSASAMLIAGRCLPRQQHGVAAAGLAHHQLYISEGCTLALHCVLVALQMARLYTQRQCTRLGSVRALLFILTGGVPVALTQSSHSINAIGPDYKTV